jgi:hypothetical protein
LTLEIKVREPKLDNPGEEALKRMVDQILLEQETKALFDVPTNELKAFYRPFKAGPELGKAYRYLNTEQTDSLVASLEQCGLTRTNIVRHSFAERIKLLALIEKLIHAQTPRQLKAAEFESLLPSLERTVPLKGGGTDSEKAQAVLKLWNAYHRFAVGLRFEFIPPSGPDRNARWAEAESLRAFAGVTEKIGQIQLEGRLTPSKRDSSDWWYVPKDFEARTWVIANLDDSDLQMTRVKSDDGYYLKVTGSSNGKYRITSEGKGRSVRRVEQREFYRDSVKPPF